MNLYASIAKRKCCRKYDLQLLNQEILEKIADAIEHFTPLFPNVPIQWRFTNKVKGRFHVEAPHYIIISGQGNPSEKENAGFLFQQLVLWFDAMEIGCVWLGESKDAQTARSKEDLIAIGFGSPKEPVHRTKEQFKRKPIDKITNTPQDECIQAVRLAPSGMNLQPWYFEKDSERVLVYQQKLKPPVSLLYKHTDIDMGIALCHYALACKERGKSFFFTRSTALPDKAGFLPFGIIE